MDGLRVFSKENIIVSVFFSQYCSLYFGLENFAKQLEKFLVYPEKAILNIKITKSDLNLG